MTSLPFFFSFDALYCVVVVFSDSGMHVSAHHAEQLHSACIMESGRLRLLQCALLQAQLYVLYWSLVFCQNTQFCLSQIESVGYNQG